MSKKYSRILYKAAAYLMASNMMLGALPISAGAQETEEAVSEDNESPADESVETQEAGNGDDTEKTGEAEETGQTPSEIEEALEQERNAAVEEDKKEYEEESDGDDQDNSGEGSTGDTEEKTEDTEEAPEEEVIVYQNIDINSNEEFLEFANNCKVNSWSRDKSVNLKVDIDLKGLDFECIPYFDGVFDGNEHEIRGLVNNEDTYISGLIRYVGINGMIQDLNVQGKMNTDDEQKYSGGLCGINQGIIRNCSYSGMMEGNNTVGPIAAINENTGLISNCKNYAYISGYYFTGGITGKNYGIVSGCENYGSINDKEAWVIKDDEKGDGIITQITDTKEDESNTLITGMDVGGIAGYSIGSVLRCTNKGNIGYEHAGYNIGGIVGRQMGIVSYSVNEGRIAGRKDIGGIVGQMEPYLEPEDLQTLPEAADTLHDLVDKTINDMDGSVDTISSDITDLTGYADGVVDDGRVLTGELTSSVNANVAVINEVIVRLEYVMEALPSVIDNISGANESLGYFNQAVARAVDAINTEDELNSEDRDSINKSENEMYSGFQAAKETADQIEELTNKINSLMYVTDENGEFAYNEDGTRQIRSLSSEEQALLNSYLAELQQITANSGGEVSGMLGNVSNILETYKPYADSSSDAVIGDINEALGALQSAQDNFHAAGNSARSIIDYLNSQSDLRLSGLSSTWDNSLDSLHNNLKGITGSLENINVDGKDSSHTLNSDFAAVNDQINVIYHILSDRLDIIQNDDAEVFTDVSDEEIEKAKTGRVDSSKNFGTIEGDINIGGIAGSMAIDEEDPEENAAGNLDIGSGSKYTLKNIICDCSNDSIVKSKKDGAGLIVGYMAHGIVTSCMGMGKVTSTEGSYTGGIAGESLSIVRDSDALCLISGKKYVGGITGFGTTVSGCLALSTWDEEPEERFGAIAGAVNTDSETQKVKMSNIKGNYFLEGDIEGIDNISYTGVAEPLSYSSLINHSGAPSDFRHLKVSFEVDDEKLGEQELSYGDSLKDITFPKGEYRKGYYIEWPDVTDMVMKGNYVITGEYKVTQKTVESKDTYEDTNKKLALLGGSYGNDAQISAKIIEEPTYEPANPLTEHEVKVYSVEIEEGTVSQSDEKKIRLYNPYKDARVKEFSEGKWVEISAKTVGSYLEIPVDGKEGIYAIVEYNSLPLKITCAVLFAIFLLVLFIIRKLIKRRIRKIKEFLDRKKKAKDNESKKEK